MSTPNQRDLVIIGGGPAGYSAALYAARASLDTLVVEQGMPGGQIATSDMIDNYPGIEQCSGAELGQKMQAHAESAGAQSTYGSVQSLTRHESGFTITTDMDSIEAKSVIVATGATPRPGNFSGEETYRGRGVSYCATCDGMFYRGKHVFIIGGGNSAVEEALYLSNLADQVEIIVRRDVFRAPRGMFPLGTKRVLQRLQDRRLSTPSHFETTPQVKRTWSRTTRDPSASLWQLGTIPPRVSLRVWPNSAPMAAY